MPTAATNPPGLTSPPSPDIRTQVKRCAKCGETKPLAQFEPRKERVSGYRNECKVCRNKAKVKTPEQVQQLAERRRKRKDEGRTERERAALSLAQELLVLADREEFAAWRGDLNALTAHVMKSGKRTPDRDAEAVRGALASPLNRNGATAADVAEDTRIAAGEVLNMLEDMCLLGTVRKAPKEVPEIARGATIWLYSLTGKEPCTAMVLP